MKTPVLEELLEAGPCVEQQFEAPVDCSDVPDNKGAKLSGKITTPSGKKEKVSFYRFCHPIVSNINLLMTGGNKRSYVLKQTCM